MTDGSLPPTPPPDEQRPETPVPFGVQEDTGDVRPPIPLLDPAGVAIDSRQVRERGKPRRKLAIVPTRDPRDIRQSGWGILFASDADPAIRAALDPLIKRREAQVNNKDLFKVFTGDDGVLPGQDAMDWLDKKGVGLAVVDPARGVPYHLLIVGSPVRISFEFQYTLDLQWSVGRLDFDTAQEFADYAKNVVEYEAASEVVARQAAMWMPSNGDLATKLLSRDVGLPFLQKPLGAEQGFALTSYLGEEATKENLAEILTGKAMPGGSPPAVLFTGSHGLEVRMEKAAEQRERQGALITQEWQPRQPVGPEACFTGGDIPFGAKLQGLIHVLFACFGGGCPKEDNYPKPGTTPEDLAPQPMVSRLPQRLLTKGALAVVGHVDRVWSYSFRTSSGVSQNQVLRSIIEAIMLGLPVGMAVDFANLQWGTLAAQLPMQKVPASITNLVVARDDARNYALFGDPAVRLRVAQS